VLPLPEAEAEADPEPELDPDAEDDEVLSPPEDDAEAVAPNASVIAASETRGAGRSRIVLFPLLSSSFVFVLSCLIKSTE
jgi:hypothetical protein